MTQLYSNKWKNSPLANQRKKSGTISSWLRNTGVEETRSFDIPLLPFRICIDDGLHSVKTLKKPLITLDVFSLIKDLKKERK